MRKEVIIPRQKLINLYTKKRLSSHEIAKIYHCCYSTILDKLRKYSIKRRHPKRKINISKNTLERLYTKQKLSTYAIAKRYHCTSTTIFYKLQEYKISTRPLKRISISKKQLKNLYFKKRLSLSQIAGKYNCDPATIFNKMKKYKISLRDTSEANTIYPKYDFNGDLTKKAYMIGFRLGDLRVRIQNKIIQAGCHTTRPEQIELIKKIFSPYGHVRIGKPDKRGAIDVECLLNKTFSFLLPKEDKVNNWILSSNRYFSAFLAGYTDAEGSIRIYNKRARFRLGSYDSGILHQIYNKLKSLGINATLILERPKGSIDKQGFRLNGDFWRLNINYKNSLRKLFELLDPYLKHPKRRKDMELAKKNVLVRSQKN